MNIYHDDINKLIEEIKKVLRGIRVDFLGDDHEIRFGARTIEGKKITVSILFHA